MSDKKIILQKVPFNDKGYMLFNRQTLAELHESIQSSLPDDCILITSPLDLKCIDGNQKIISIECKEYSANELLDIIEKADMYDGLCK